MNARPLMLLSLALSLPVAGQSASGMLNVSRFPGADWGAQVTACIAALPQSGGTCDARDLTGTQRISRTLVITSSHVRVLLGAGTIRIDPGAELQVLGSDVSIVGLGKQASTFSVGGDVGIRVGNADTIARKWLFESVGVVSATDSRRRIGLELLNAREGRIQSALLAGFKAQGASAIRVGNDCWTVLLDDVNVSSNDTGISIVGGNFNAWVVRSSLIVMNSVGILFDSGTGTGQGVAITDGTHFEGNRVAGIWFRSGDFQQVGISNAYVETFAGQAFVLMRGTGRAPIRVRSFQFDGGFLFTTDEPPFRFDASKGDSDAVFATLLQIHDRTSSRQVPVAVFRGRRARGIVLAPVVVDAKENYASGDSMVSSLEDASAVLIAQPAGDGALTFLSGIEIGPGGVGSAAITGHSSATVPVTFQRWSGSSCQDRSVRFEGVRPGDSISLSVPTELATTSGLLFSAFVTKSDAVTIRGCKVTAEPAPAPLGPSTVRLDAWRH